MSELDEKIHQLNEQAWSDRNKDVQASLQLAQQVHEMLQESPQTNSREWVINLRTQAYCLEHLSRYGEALTSAMRAKELADPLGDRRLLASLENELGNIYWRLADYSAALDHYLRGLQLLQSDPDPDLEIFLVQGLGTLHYEMGEHEEALKYFKRSIESIEAVDAIGKAIGLNNMSYTLHEMKRDQEALEYALQAMDLFESGPFSVGKLEAMHTLGSIYFELGEIDRASQYFEKVVRTAVARENPLQTINALFGLCHIHELRGELDEARHKLLQILELSRDIQSPASQCSAHELLAKIYKQMGEYRLALDHYEIFHTLHVQIFNRQAEQRLHNTQVLLEVETIRKQANLYRALAATDALTGLLSRREFFELGEKAIHQAQNRQVPVSLLMVDMDNFKSINDQYGHAVGDRVLAIIAARLKNTLRQDDLAGRYGGDEFVILMPDINLPAGQKIAERCQQVVERKIEIDTLTLWMKISIGLAVLEADTSRRLEELIHQADQALLVAKKSGRNRVIVSGSL